MTIKNMGTALRYCIPQSVGKKLGEFWELMKVCCFRNIIKRIYPFKKQIELMNYHTKFAAPD